MRGARLLPIGDALPWGTVYPHAEFHATGSVLRNQGLAVVAHSASSAAGSVRNLRPIT